MARHEHSLKKRIGIDIAGFGLIFLGIAFGWLPGPGGIPLILAGLGVLAQNYEWAQRLQDRIIKQGKDAFETLFPGSLIIQRVYDAVTLGLLLQTYYIFTLDSLRGRQWDALGAFSIALALVIFLGNRKRLARISGFFSKK